MVYSRSLFLIYFKSNSMNMSIPILKFCLLQITNFLLVPISLFSKSLNLFPFSKLCHLYPFLDLTYKWMMWYLTLCLTYFTLYDLLWVHQCCCNGTFHSFLGWGICHCIYVQFLYPYICLRISYMPQRLGCCIQCCSEKKKSAAVNISCMCMFKHDFLQILAQKWSCLVALLCVFWKTSNVLSILTSNLHFPQMQRRFALLQILSRIYRL